MADDRPPAAPDQSGHPAEPTVEPGKSEDAVDAGPHLVVLVHGIRTHAEWYVAVRNELEKEGFTVALSSYGRLDLFRFLVPVPYFRKSAANKVERLIHAAMDSCGAKRLSVIAHSFGTCIISILLRETEIRFRKIIFCGSVVSSNFPFQAVSGRYETIVNEVGTRDYWPILASSGTWGYGSTGAFGFKHPRVFDRYHRGVSHSAFLNPEFCRKWWFPILGGEKPDAQPGEQPENPPLGLRILSIFQIKYIVAAALALFVGYQAYDSYYVGKFMLANISIKCSTADSSKLPPAHKLLTIISSPDLTYIHQVSEVLRNNSFMQNAANKSITPVIKSSLDGKSRGGDVYKLIVKYRNKHKAETAFLDMREQWIAYTVDIPSDYNTSVPLPTAYGRRHTTHFYAIVDKHDLGGDQALNVVNATATATPVNKSLQLILEAEMEPKKAPDWTNLNVDVLGKQICWQ